MSTHAIPQQSRAGAAPRATTESHALRLTRRIGFIALALLFGAMTVLPLLVLIKVSFSAPPDIMTARPPFLLYNPTLDHWRAILNVETRPSSSPGTAWWSRRARRSLPSSSRPRPPT